LKKIRVAIIGTGNIGTDLCARMLRDSQFEVVALAGRRPESPGLEMFRGEVPYLLNNGIDDLVLIADEFDGFFDATSAFDHQRHWLELQPLGKWAIDLTPSQVGKPMVPELIGASRQFSLIEDQSANYSMVTCGGQSSAPLIFAMARHSKGISEVEVSSSIASKSAGPATRRNIDQYVQSTENLVSIISGCDSVKAILVLNPAEPPVMMRTTVQMRVTSCDLEATHNEVQKVILKIQQYVPGYNLVVEPHFSIPNVVTGTVKVTGAGYVLPEYSGNLDIINAAAVETARRHSQKLNESERSRI
jgi:acetaldehyde dehydrogenase